MPAQCGLHRFSVFNLVGESQIFEGNIMNTETILPALQAGVMNYGPKILMALVILIVAYIVAKIISWIVSYVVGKSGIGDDSARQDLRSGASSAAFWVVMLIAIPLILEPLGMQGILAPLQSMVQKFLTFLPNLIGAAVIFGIGYIVATVAKKAVAGVLSATNFDGWLSRAGMGNANLGNALANLVFVLLIVPIGIAALDALKIDAISTPATAMLRTMMDAVPNIIGAGIIIGLSFIIARFASSVLSSLLPGLGVDTVGEKIGLTNELGGSSISRIAANLAFAAIMIFGFIEGAKILNFAILSEMLAQILSLGGRILLGSAIIAAGVFIANFIANLVGSTKSGANVAGLLKVAIIILAAAMGLRQMGIANEIITMGFSLMMGALALGAAIAIGWGGKDAAGKLLDRWVKKL
jgi:hypothetical protein